MEHLRVVYRESAINCAAFPKQDDPRWQSETVYCNDYRLNQDGETRGEEDRRISLEALCTSLQGLLCDPSTHFTAIDAKLSENFVFYPHASRLDPFINEDQAIQAASQLLLRLPAAPPKIELAYHVWGSSSSSLDYLEKFCSSRLQHNDDANRLASSHPSPWTELVIVSKISTVVARLALLVVTTGDDRFNIGSAIGRFVDLISELIEATERMKMATDRYAVAEHSILQAFLWVTWQRSLMLFFWFVLRSQLQHGYSKRWNDMLALRGCSLLMHPSIRATLYGHANTRHSYMCSWAFQLIVSSRASMGLDFRRFHERFAILHQNQPARCKFESDEACDGGHPMSCGRFQDKRLVKEEQSMHDLTCTGGCKKLKWNEASYRAIQGPTAVALRSGPEDIHYTMASESTLAISHVWSHGQGSRPNIGINQCLHKRYLEIAQAHEADSYWIDSLCIPETHDLRMEAIGFINKIFADSCVTLVCDRDIMDIDMADFAPSNYGLIDVNDVPIELIESVLVTFFVCDWNVRAWTLLEAMKGSHSIYLHTKFNKILSLRDALTRVHQEGSVDIAILSLTTRHLLPSSTYAFRRSSSRQSIEEAGTLLSHRHATRDGDDIVIWSLLSGTRVYNSAEELWKSKVNTWIATAYLMSTAPRLEETRGFSWAPKTPYVRRFSPEPATDLLGPYNSYECADSELGLITLKGLRANWLIYIVRPEDAELYRDSPTTMVTASADGKREKRIIHESRITNNCWHIAVNLMEGNEHVALIQPLTFQGAEKYRAAKDRGESHGEVFGIVVSRDGEQWRWIGVWAWSGVDNLPPMVVDELLIL